MGRGFESLRARHFTLVHTGDMGDNLVPKGRSCQLPRKDFAARLPKVNKNSVVLKVGLGGQRRESMQISLSRPGPLHGIVCGSVTVVGEKVGA